MIIILAVLLAVAVITIGLLLAMLLREKAFVESAIDINRDLREQNRDLEKVNFGLRRTLRIRTHRLNKRIARLQLELRDEQERSLQLVANHAQRQTTLDRQLAQAHALLGLVLEQEDAGRLRPDERPSRDRMRELFCV